MSSSGFALTSPDIAPGSRIAARHVYGGCGGENVSPALAWSGAPHGTQGYALTCYDPDAPTGSGWWHWVLYNLPASVTALPAGAGSPEHPILPAGAVQGRTDYGEHGYGGPCPPPGPDHRYVFTVFALDVPQLELPADATAAMIGFHLHAHALATATLLGVYGR
jgi:Raf kinase inhibitor-like YbhB/YbcL family protein